MGQAVNRRHPAAAPVELLDDDAVARLGDLVRIDQLGPTPVRSDEVAANRLRIKRPPRGDPRGVRRRRYA